MTKLMIIACVVVSATRFAFANENLDNLLKNAACSGEVNKALDEKLKKQFWINTFISLPAKSLMDGVHFRDSAAQKAYYLWNENDATFYVETALNNKWQTVNKWEKEKGCKAVQSKKPLLKFKFQQFPGSFNDDKLFSLLKTHQRGVIYVWSPYMPLSVEGIENAVKAAARNELPITVLLDGKASLKDAQQWKDKFKFMKPEYFEQVSANELFSRNMAVHYPIMFYYDSKFISNRTYIGHKSEDIFDQWMKLEIENTRKDLK